jgi:hypothetical protein
MSQQQQQQQRWKATQNNNLIFFCRFAHLLSMRDAFVEWCDSNCSSGNSTPLENVVIQSCDDDNVDDDNDMIDDVRIACKTLINK